MILYFSATGNSEFVARSMAAYLEDENIVNMEDCIREERYEFQLAKGETLGIVCPVHFLTLPKLVADYLSRLRITSPKSFYTHFTSTYGTASAQVGKDAKRVLAESGIELHMILSVRMPDTWTPTYDLSDTEKVEVMNDAALEQIEFNYSLVRKRRIGNESDGRLPRAVVAAGSRLFKNVDLTEHLSASDTCTGCGLCARRCPVQAIEMQDNKPVWVKERCAMCLRCLHSCPAFAIQYDDGSATSVHGQYTHPPFVSNPEFVEEEPRITKDKLVAAFLKRKKK